DHQATTRGFFRSRRLDGIELLHVNIFVLRGKGKEFGHHLVFVQAEKSGIRADETAVEDSPRKFSKILCFQGLERAEAALRGVGDLLQRDVSHFSFPSEVLAAWTHACVRLSRLVYDRSIVVSDDEGSQSL